MPVEILKYLLKKNGFKNIKIAGSGKAIEIFPDWLPVMGVFASYLTILSKD
ncbi:MAG: hypothetical protein ACR2KX_20455 [Chitinophagaceae bacterium]